MMMGGLMLPVFGDLRGGDFWAFDEFSIADSGTVTRMPNDRFFYDFTIT